MARSTIDEAISSIARGGMAIVIDSEDRENEGDLIMAADAATPEAIAFMVRYCSGLICAAFTPERLAQLQLPLMVEENTESRKTAFTVSVDVKDGITTGISAADRAKTVLALARESTIPSDLARPGHVFPLRAHPQGILGRPGHTEAAVELARLAGRVPGGVLCEVVNDDGTMARRPELEMFARTHRLPIISIEHLIEYIRKRGDHSPRTVPQPRNLEPAG